MRSSAGRGISTPVRFCDALVRADPPPGVVCAPHAAPQALQLQDQAVVNEQVDLGPPCLDVPAAFPQP